MKIFGSKATTALVCGALLISGVSAVPLAGIALGLTMFGSLAGASYLSQANRAPEQEKALIILDDTLSAVRTFSQSFTAMSASPLELEIISVKGVAKDLFEKECSEITIASPKSNEIKTFNNLAKTHGFLTNKYNNLPCKGWEGFCEDEDAYNEEGRVYDFLALVQTLFKKLICR